MGDMADDIEIHRSPVASQVATTARDVGLAITFVTTIMGLISKRDLWGAITFLQSDAAGIAITTISGAVAAGIVAYRQWRARWWHKVLVEAAESEPQTKVKVI